MAEGLAYSYWGKDSNGNLKAFTKDNIQEALPGSIYSSNDNAGSSWSGGDNGWFTNQADGVVGSIASGNNNGIGISGGMDWLNQSSKGLGTLAGLGSLGMNAYSTFFGQGKESFDKNMKLLDQNIANNEYIAKKHAGVDAAWAKQQAKQDGLGTVVS